jgi:transposase
LAARRAGNQGEHGLPVEPAQTSRLDAQKKSQHAAEQERPDVAQARRDWIASQSDLNPEKLVFIDETGTATDMARRYGRNPRGERLVATVPRGHWKTVTLVAALRSSGLTAPCVFDGPMNGECFRAYVEQVLAPTLKPGETVVLDNLASHKVVGVRQAIEATGARVRYLPAYSPDLNPIEQAIAKLKAILRKAAARTVTALITAIAAALMTFTEAECANYLRHCGYRQKL